MLKCSLNSQEKSKYLILHSLFSIEGFTYTCKYLLISLHCGALYIIFCANLLGLLYKISQML